MPVGVNQAIQAVAQDVLALAVILFGASGIFVIVSERARKLLLDRMLGELVARASRKRLTEEAKAEASRVRDQRIEDAVTALSEGLMVKITTDPMTLSQKAIDTNVEAQTKVLAAAVVLQGELPGLREHLDKVIEWVNDPEHKRGAAATYVNRELIRPIQDAVAASRRG